jgi:hypothetical protein
MIMPTQVGFGTFAALREEQISEKISRRIVGRPGVCARRANAQDTLMIGKTSSAVAMKYARPTTPRRANAAKDTFQRSCHPLVSWGCVFHFSVQQ